MKTNFTLIIFLCISNFLFSQNPPDNFFDDFTTSPCSWDTSVMIQALDSWTIYQTQNDQWDGPIDSTRCIGVYESGIHVNIDLTDVDRSKPIFVRSNLEDADPIPLTKDNLYNVSFSGRLDDDLALELGADCANGLCSGIILGIEIPDSLGTGRTQRIYQSSVKEVFNNNFNPSTCYATERFDLSLLKTYVLKLTIKEGAGEWIQLRNTFNEDFEWSTFTFSSLEIPEAFYQDTSYEYNISNLANPFNYTNFLALYNDSTYPNPLDPSFVEISPEPNVSTSELINIYMDYHQNIFLQPYTFLRGGLIEGSDSIRHQYNIINGGSEICMYPFIELGFSETNGFIHQSGGINFHDNTSCMMFRNGGILTVDEDAYLEYGDGGEGILALGRSARVFLKKGSTLLIDNKVMLLDVLDDTANERIKVDLEPGSALIFEENASLIRAAGAAGNQMLDVYMNGGLLDDHHLTDEERALINRIYPEEQVSYYPEEEALIFPNPVRNVLNCRFINAISETLQLEITNINGAVVYQDKIVVREGINELVIAPSLPTKGIYVLKLHRNEGMISQKFIRM